MPRGGEGELSPWLFFCIEQEGSGTPNAPADTFETGPEAGFHFYCDRTYLTTAWHPATGSRYGPSAEIAQSGTYGHQRSTTMAGTQTSYFLTIVPTTVFPHDNATGTASCASAISVRCIRE